MENAAKKKNIKKLYIQTRTKELDSGENDGSLERDTGFKWETDGCLEPGSGIPKTLEISVSSLATSSLLFNTRVCYDITSGF